MILLVARRISLVLLLGCVADVVLAETEKANVSNDFYNLSLAELGQVEISIATGNSNPLDKVPATASVIYAAEIAAMGAHSLNDVLESVPGLHVSVSSLSRLDSVYSIRGIHTGFNQQVLLLLNGVPVQTSVQGGRPTLFRLPVNSIDRIEVIRGPGSAIYGADAYSGVINVITKDANAIDRTEIGVRSGSFNSRDFWLQTATHWQGVGVALDVAYQETDGDKSRIVNSDLQSNLDKIFGTHASLAPGPLSTRYQILDTHLALTSEQLQANLWHWLATNTGVGAGGAQALDYEGRNNSQLVMGDVTYHLPRQSEAWDNSIHLSYVYYNIVTFFNLLPEGTVLPIGHDGNLNFTAPAGIVRFPDGLAGNPGSIVRDTQFDAISVFNGWDSHRIRMAAGARRQTVAPYETKNFGPGVIDGTVPVIDGSVTDVTDTEYIYLADGQRMVHYVSLQDEWQLHRDLQLTTGLRYDHYSDFGSTTNPRIALVWAANEKLTTKLMYGSAFRAPSFSELRFKNNPVSLGNINLTSEHIDTVELSFTYRISDDFQTTLTLFDYDARDMIEFTPDKNATTKTAQNARDQRGNGFEWEIKWNPTAAFRLSASYSLQDAQDSDTHADVPDAPGQQYKVNANWEFHSNWLLNGQLYWVGDRERAAQDLRSPIADYTLLNITVRRNNILPNLDVSLAVRNATDEDIREPSSGVIPDDYPMESRSAWIELQYAFK